jgi:hypothetical protein
MTSLPNQTRVVRSWAMALKPSAYEGRVIVLR